MNWRSFSWKTEQRQAEMSPWIRTFVTDIEDRLGSQNPEGETTRQWIVLWPWYTHGCAHTQINVNRLFIKLRETRQPWFQGLEYTRSVNTASSKGSCEGGRRECEAPVLSKTPNQRGRNHFNKGWMRQARWSTASHQCLRHEGKGIRSFRLTLLLRKLEASQPGIHSTLSPK